MSEIYPQDIEATILNRLKDATNGIRAQLTTINTNRGQSTPIVANVDISTERRDNNPEVIVDYEESEISGYFNDTDNSDLRKTCEVTISAFLTSADLENIKKYVSNYIEAITKCLNSYSTGNITICNASSDIITDLYNDMTESARYGGVRFTVLINGGV